jgi:hypothetical protein
MQEVLRALDARSARPLTVLLTVRVNGRPPVHGDDTVVWCIGDEWARMPSYAHDVALVCKVYGARWTFTSPTAPFPLRSLRQDLATQGHRWGYQTTGAWRSLRHGHRAPVMHVPLGPRQMRVVAFVPFEQRGCDLRFRGSLRNEIEGKPSEQWHPKTESRKRLYDAAGALAARRPDLRADVRLTSSFRESVDQDPAEYYAALMQTRVLLCPRGGSLETFRHYEGLMSGCVVVTDRVPLGPLRSAPFVRVRDWARLDRVLEPLLDDPARLRELSDASRAWWLTTAAPDAVANRIVAALAR